MKKSLWQIHLGVMPIAMSALFYGIHCAIQYETIASGREACPAGSHPF